MRALGLVVGLVAVTAWPCSLAERPNGGRPADGGVPILANGNGDGVAPSAPVVSSAKVTLITAPCDGRGAACPESDSLAFTVAASDDRTAPSKLRYLAYFGGTEAEVAAASPGLLFDAETADPTAVGARLGASGARSGQGFDRAALCFALAAADEAANVSPRSAVTCLDTKDASKATVVKGSPCGEGCGCGAGAAVPSVVGLLALLLTASKRRRAAPPPRAR